jgi:hypothetical protein
MKLIGKKRSSGSRNRRSRNCLFDRDKESHCFLLNDLFYFYENL